MLFLGFSSGLPFGALAEPLSAWLTEAGLGKTEIGLFALVSLPYSLKFIFAPFVDRLALPVLGRCFGRRRGWALATQVLLIAVLLGLGATQPGIDPLATAVLALCVAFASATQDTVIDAYRVEILEERSQAAGAATATFGWRLGQMAAGAGGLILADVLPWSTVYALMAAAVLVGVIAILLNPEPRTRSSPGAQMLEVRAQAWLQGRQGARLPPSLANVAAWVWAACVCPFVEFATRRGWVVVLLFILLYKFGDAILGVMKVPFFLEIGFSKTDIAEIVKLFGFVATVAGSLIGGLVVARLGIMRGLLVCGVAMALSNLVFVLQAWAGPDIGILALTVSVENITTGMGMTAFVAYMSSLCNVAYTATQYALLTSLMAMGRTVLSSGAGWLADQVPWPTFFVLTTLAAVPGLLLLVLLMRRYQPSGGEHGLSQ
ncbi:MAG: AmpG family muropeptide MFS transporter [Rhodospirillales bacterium]|nr:AmpG family muropeptide MFS transporter [Rhodospirillales bacterium]